MYFYISICADQWQLLLTARFCECYFLEENKNEAET